MTSQFTSEQRKALADMLKKDGTVRDQAIAKRTDARDELETAIIDEMAKKKNLSQLAAEIIAFRKELAAKEKELERAGFDLEEDGELSIRWGATALRTSVEKRLDKEIGTHQDIHKQFDSAAVEVWTAETVEEAKKIVNSLL